MVRVHTSMQVLHLFIPYCDSGACMEQHSAMDRIERGREKTGIQSDSQKEMAYCVSCSVVYYIVALRCAALYCRNQESGQRRAGSLEQKLK